METRGVTLDQDELGQQTREFWIKNLFIARDQEREISACIKDYDENETISTTGGNHESPQMQYKDKIWNMNDKEDLEKRQRWNCQVTKAHINLKQIFLA